MSKKSGVVLIAEERNRQINEKLYTSSKDDNLIKGELANAAACYATTHYNRYSKNFNLEAIWDFDKEMYKPEGDNEPYPEGRIRELAKAGALIAAEIDRLQRIKK